MSKPQEEFHIGLRKQQIKETLEMLTNNFEDVVYVKSNCGSVLVNVKATVKKLPSLKSLQNLCNQYSCRCKVVTDYKKATITFYDEEDED